MKRFYVTSPIFYPNAQPHMGHAYTTLLCDVLVRYHKTLGEETYFLTGTDEHTEKVIQAAKAQKQQPEQYLEDIVARFKDLYTRLDIQYDQFIRTSDQTIHWPGAIEMWKRLYQAGDLYKSSYTGLYCIGHEAFMTEKELVNGRCPDHGTAPEKITEENWFFRLKKYAPQIKELIEDNKLLIIPDSRKKEILSFVASGLVDVSFSRPKEKMTRGIPVPNDPSQTMYIWVDALTNYITALGFGRGENLMYFWPGTHIIGKDILRFHTVFWPAMLLSANLTLPKTVFVHGTIISGGKKMSKTIGNVISPYEMIERYGKDATRYLLLKHVHPYEDTDITWEHLDEWYTAHLAKGIGNTLSRVMKLAQHLESPIAEVTRAWAIDQSKKNNWKNLLQEDFRFDQALDQALVLPATKIDKFINENKPFETIKVDKNRAIRDISKALEGLLEIGEALKPFMPSTSDAILNAVHNNKKPETLFPRKD